LCSRGRATRALTEFHYKIRDAVEANGKLDEYCERGYRLYPVVGIEQPTNQSARLGAGGVTILGTFEDKDYFGDGTVPRVSATPLELSNDPRETFVATKHAALQNAAAVLTHLTGVIASLYVNLDRFRREEVETPPPPPGTRLALDLDDAYYASEPIKARVRATTGADSNTPLIFTATLTRGGTRAMVEQTVVRVNGDTWEPVTFRALRPGLYRLTVSGAGEVQPVSDVFAVLKQTA
jgi:hypothetical protein